MKYNKFFSFDAETECLRLTQNKPWQFAFVLFDHKKVILEKEYWIWWPDLKMSTGAAIATKFDWNTYERKANPKHGAPTAFLPEDFLNDVEQYLLDETIAPIGQNVLGFDCHIIGDLQKKIRGKADFSFISRMYDTMLLHRGLKLGLKPDLENMSAWQYKILNHIPARKIKANLKSLCNEYGVEYDAEGHHDAFVDVKMTMNVFNQMKYSFQ